jgi:hypothetical protein
MFFSQCFTIRKGLIKHKKSNEITPTKIHVDSAYPRLFA